MTGTARKGKKSYLGIEKELSMGLRCDKPTWDVGRTLEKLVRRVIYKLFSCSPNIPSGFMKTQIQIHRKKSATDLSAKKLRCESHKKRKKVHGLKAENIIND